MVAVVVVQVVVTDPRLSLNIDPSTESWTENLQEHNCIPGLQRTHIYIVIPDSVCGLGLERMFQPRSATRLRPGLLQIWLQPG